MKIRMSELKRLVKRTINELYEEKDELGTQDADFDEPGPSLDGPPEDMDNEQMPDDMDDEPQMGSMPDEDDEDAPTSIEDVPTSANALRTWFDNFVAPDLAEHPEQIPVFHRFVLKFKQLATGEDEPGGPQLKTRASAITKRLKGLAADNDELKANKKSEKDSKPKSKSKTEQKADKKDKDDDKDKEGKD